MSCPSGFTCTSPRENSATCAPFHCWTQPSRSNIWPSALTPIKGGERWRSKLAQSLSRTACHISRSCSFAPVAVFQEGCLGEPAQPAATKHSPTTKDTKEHEEYRCRFLAFTKRCIVGSQ